MSNITITPEDREAAADFLYGFNREMYASQIKETLRGYFDSTKAVKAFARHRLSGHQQGVAEERERAASIADVFADEKDVLALSSDESNFASYREGERTAKQIAESIRTPNKGEATTNITSEG